MCVAQHIPTRAPVLQPVGAIDLILVEQLGDARRQLIALAQRPLLAHPPPQLFARRAPLGLRFFREETAQWLIDRILR